MPSHIQPNFVFLIACSQGAQHVCVCVIFLIIIFLQRDYRLQSC